MSLLFTAISRGFGGAATVHLFPDLYSIFQGILSQEVIVQFFASDIAMSIAVFHVSTFVLLAGFVACVTVGVGVTGVGVVATGVVGA